MRCFLVLVALGIGSATVATAAPKSSCASVATCEQQCKDGAGTATACTQLAALLQAGIDGADPDYKRAEKLYTAACEGKGRTSASRTTDVADPQACFRLAELARTGWYFDVERDLDRHRHLLERAIELGAAQCVRDKASCAVAANAAIVLDNLGTRRPAPTDIVRWTEIGCNAGDLEACALIREHSRDWESSGMDAKRITDLRNAVTAELGKACKAGNGSACLDLLDDSIEDVAKYRAAIDKACDANDKSACIAKGALLIDAAEDKNDVAKLAQGLKLAITACEGGGPPVCSEIAEEIAEGVRELNMQPDFKRAGAILEGRCSLGDADACAEAAEIYGDTDTGVADASKARRLGRRACLLGSPTSDCDLCDREPDADVCTIRAAHQQQVKCDQGNAGMCEVVAARFRDGAGVPKDIEKAATLFRRACDNLRSRKSACASLRQLCSRNGSLSNAVCEQSLVHSDLFYEAEWRFETTGVAELQPDKLPVPGAPPTVAMPDAPGSPGLSLQRGSLNTDLVVSVVLDRARRAAIDIVVKELGRVGRGAQSTYLRELLQQGAVLLTDSSTMRREKMKDLAMIVVRAFVATHLVDTLFPSAKALREAPVLGPLVQQHEAALGFVPDDPKLPARVRTYLVDIAYETLAAQSLFARTVKGTTAPACPFAANAKPVCDALASPEAIASLLRVDRLLDGLQLARALRSWGRLDLRRFVEAVNESRAIASFERTPGLSLKGWKQELVEGVRARGADFKLAATEITALISDDSYANAAQSLPVVAGRRLDKARALLASPHATLLLGADSVVEIRRILTLLDESTRMPGLNAPEARKTADDAAREAIVAILKNWTGRQKLIKSLQELTTSAETMQTKVLELEALVVGIESMLARLQPADGSRAAFDLGTLPLHAATHLRASYATALSTLREIRKSLHKIEPGAEQLAVDFAVSATVRLLGLLSVMEQLALVSRLDQTCGSVLEALKFLGTNKAGTFSAPLYDLVEPVLDRIKTHQPLGVEELFAIVAKVRLDTLIPALQSTASVCDDPKSADCWTTKLVHALQESVEQEGNTIRVDGGKLAKRLADHGDDFRRKNTWRWYFHLAVGVGGLYSDPVADSMPTTARAAPLIAEQIGMGRASPGYFDGAVTLKVGAAASGILYRAVLDSAESDAVILHPLFFAVDIKELIELYVSPVGILIYPPTGNGSTEVKWGFSAGLNVPLSAYLERL